MPYPYSELSVTRHKGLSESQIWRIGQRIVESQLEPRTLHGRADFATVEARKRNLQVEATPVPENLNHAIVTGWPSDKASQKTIAQELAAVARFTRNPQSPVT
jgi:hypothetical protein